MENVSFGVLDFGFRHSGLNSLLRLEDVVKSAVEAEKLGFSRYWLSEHHFSQKTLAWSNPQAVLPVLASATSQIKIGVAGILLSMYSPYHIATFFKMLNNIFHRRIDLGIANGNPNAHAVRYATESDRVEQGKSFEEKFERLVYFLRSDEELYNQGEGVVLPPYKGEIPEVWTLSSSAYRTAERVVKLKVNLSRSICHERAEKDFARERLAQLREDYFAQHGEYPRVNLVIGVICHKTMQKARKIAEAFPADAPFLNIVGCPNYFYDRIAGLQEEYGVEEFMLYNYAIDTPDRYLAMRLISRQFHLAAKPVLHEIA
jgi:luciferase family oxidoreductase group 1